MRTTEVLFGVFAGVAGLVLAVLSMQGILPYSAQTLSSYSMETIRVYSYVCIGASVVGIAGALLVLKHHAVGSAMMMVVMVVLMVFGFPWQSIAAVAFIISVVLAMVPVKTEAEQGGEQSE